MNAAATAAGLPRLEKYELLEEIGHGGMATVYRARDPRLGREVAVKVIHKHLRENTEVGTRFVAEARAAAKLRHPGIVEVFDVSNEDDPERYLVVELVRGTTLRKVLQSHRDMPAEVGAAIVMQLCEAVEHAHASSIIHRDIKPENVLVELPQDRLARADPASYPQRETPANDSAESTPAPKSDGGDTPEPGSVTMGPRAAPNPSSAAPSSTLSSVRDAPSSPRGSRLSKPDKPLPKARLIDPGVVIKITDFGIAKILDAQGVTSTGQVLGSPAHMAPEQIDGGEVDPRTDVFALGVLLYECLVGHLPFEGKNPAQVLRRVLEGTYPAADHERPTVGARWARIAAAALAREPADRIASASKLAAEIDAELKALGITDPRAEIAAYFADAAAYTSGQAARLVPRLVARGEAARKARDMRGAAADWNRALALAPDDLTILKRIASLTSSAGRRRLLRRAGVILAGSTVLGLAAFGIARAWKVHTPTREPLPAPSVALDESASPDPPTDRTPRTAPPPSSQAPHAQPSARPSSPPAPTVRVAATPVIASLPPAPPASGTRDVKFVIRPGGAKLSVDGTPRAQWFTQAIPLSIGLHTVEATPLDEHCCKKAVAKVDVQASPPGKPAEPQIAYVAMEINPAMVRLASSAPEGASLSCRDIGLVVLAGRSAEARLRDLDWAGTCVFSAPDGTMRSATVALKAGEPKSVPWPM